MHNLSIGRMVTIMHSDYLLKNHGAIFNHLDCIILAESILKFVYAIGSWFAAPSIATK